MLKNLRQQENLTEKLISKQKNSSYGWRPKRNLRVVFLSYNYIVPQNNKKYNSLFKIFIRKRDEISMDLKSQIITDEQCFINVLNTLNPMGHYNYNNNNAQQCPCHNGDGGSDSFSWHKMEMYGKGNVLVVEQAEI